MYTIEEVLKNIDVQLVAVLAAGFAVMGGAYTQYIEGIRIGFKHRTHAIPVFANMYFFAHDIVFVALYRYWFSEINHWLFKLFWVAILPFLVLECVVHYQTLKYSRQELFPGLTQGQYVLAYVAMQLGVGVLFWFIYSLLDDPLFLVNFALTEIVSNVWNLPRLLSLRSRKGQSLVQATGLLVGSNIAFFFFMLPMLLPTFNRVPVLAVGTCLTGMNLLYMWMMSKHPPYEVKEQEPGQLALSATPAGS